MTDPNVMTCHFCGTTKAYGDTTSAWWNLQRYRDHFTGLACSSCYDIIATMSDAEVKTRRVAAAVEKELSR